MLNDNDNVVKTMITVISINKRGIIIIISSRIIPVYNLSSSVFKQLATDVSFLQHTSGNLY